MSWKWPDANLVETEVVSSDDLNNGFFPVAQEAQGRINEHNLAAGVVPSAAFGASTFIPDTHVESDSNVCLAVRQYERQRLRRAAEGGNGRYSRGLDYNR